ncbi:hypothetical protein MLD38_022390 [Melastoma candidum]|uniref:Uncharacterized protein n=1 Tax=Melastoma candidum TaxID=119954 RepID=A0ACB9QJ37_9MYRT|nr:hypothetical protein MLD38_022390 [Melastoma candidum]
MVSPELLASDLGRKKGQPSKNLMAERRRRKRLRDRLSPRLARTSIFVDTINYVKELFRRINQLEQGTGKQTTTDHVFELLKESRPKEALVRNSPKFHVERRNGETAIEIRCVRKPGMLLAAMSTLEALGLEVEHCVASCFNDFVMRASCSKVRASPNTIIHSRKPARLEFESESLGGRGDKIPVYSEQAMKQA